MLSGEARAGPSPGELLGPRGRVGEVSHKGHTPSRPDPARCLFARGEARPRAGTQQLPSCCRSWEAPRQPRAQHAALRDFAGSILPPVTGPARGEGTRVAAERAHVATGGVMLFKGRGCSFFFARTRRTARKPLESTTSQRGLGLATIGAIVAFCAATRGAARRSGAARRGAASITSRPPLRRPRDAAAARRAAICGTRRRNADPSGILARPAAPTPAMTRAGCYGAGAPHENSQGAPKQPRRFFKGFYSAIAINYRLWSQYNARCPNLWNDTAVRGPFPIPSFDRIGTSPWSINRQASTTEERPCCDRLVQCLGLSALGVRGIVTVWQWRRPYTHALTCA